MASSPKPGTSSDAEQVTRQMEEMTFKEDTKEDIGNSVAEASIDTEHLEGTAQDAATSNNLFAFNQDTHNFNVSNTSNVNLNNSSENLNDSNENLNNTNENLNDPNENLNDSNENLDNTNELNDSIENLDNFNENLDNAEILNTTGFTCSRCNITLSSPNHLLRHGIRQHDEAVTLLDTSNSSINLNETDTVPIAAYNDTCPLCDKEFTKPNNLIKHGANEHGVKFAIEGWKKCPYCDFYYETDEKLNAHIRSAHTDVFKEKNLLL